MKRGALAFKKKEIASDPAVAVVGCRWAGRQKKILER